MTTIYRIEFSDLVKAYEAPGQNIYVPELIAEDGFNAFGIDEFYPGSILDGDTLYLLVTDFEPVNVGETVIDDPSELLDIYDIDELESFIQDPDSKTIRRYLSKYELALPDIDLEEATIKLLGSGLYDLADIVRAIDDIGILQDLL